MEVRIITIKGNIITGKVNRISECIVSLEKVEIEQIVELGDFKVFSLYSDNDCAIIFKENIKKIDVI